MRLLIDAHCFDYGTSEGINTYLSGLYRELVKIATDIDFFFVAHDIDKIRVIFGEFQNTHYVPLTATNRIYRLLFEFPKIIRQYKIDAAHYQYISPLIKNCKNIITLHDILFKDYPKMFPLRYRIVKGILFKLSALRSDMLLTVSQYSKDRIAYHYGIPKDKIFVTPNAVSDDFFNIDAKVAHQFIQNKGIEKYLLYVSRIEPRKNQVILLQAFHELELYKQGYDLVFIGRRTLPTPEFDHLLYSLNETELKHIHIFNQVDYEELRFWYKAASLFVYPALAEGFGIPPIEAGAAEIPCICSNKTAMSDFSFFENNLIDISDLECFKETIISNLMFLPGTKSISQQIHEKCNWSTIAKDFYMKIQSPGM